MVFILIRLKSFARKKHFVIMGLAESGRVSLVTGGPCVADVTGGTCSRGGAGSAAVTGGSCVADVTSGTRSSDGSCPADVTGRSRATDVTGGTCMDGGSRAVGRVG